MRMSKSLRYYNMIRIVSATMILIQFSRLSWATRGPVKIATIERNVLIGCTTANIVGEYQIKPFEKRNCPTVSSEGLSGSAASSHTVLMPNLP